MPVYSEHFSRISRAPFAAICGFLALPMIHLAVRSRLCSAKSMAKLLAGSPAPCSMIDDLESCFAISDAIDSGCGFWRIRDSSCLSRSILLWAICLRKGYQATIEIGRPTEESIGTAPFHAWVEINTNIINEKPDVANRYHKFPRPWISFLDVT